MIFKIKNLEAETELHQKFISFYYASNIEKLHRVIMNLTLFKVVIHALFIVSVRSTEFSHQIVLIYYYVFSSHKMLARGEQIFQKEKMVIYDYARIHYI